MSIIQQTYLNYMQWALQENSVSQEIVNAFTAAGMGLTGAPSASIASNLLDVNVEPVVGVGDSHVYVSNKRDEDAQVLSDKDNKQFKITNEVLDIRLPPKWGPEYVHTCDRCEFVGSIVTCPTFDEEDKRIFDLYICENSGQTEICASFEDRDLIFCSKKEPMYIVVRWGPSYPHVAFFTESDRDDVYERNITLWLWKLKKDRENRK